MVCFDNSKIRDLKNKISALEWDIPNLKNEKTKVLKIKELNKAKLLLHNLCTDQTYRN